MQWKHAESTEWQEPLALAAQFPHAEMALLYSGRQEAHSGAHSYLGVGVLEVVEGNDWSALPPSDVHNAANLPDWIGFLSYEMGTDVSLMPPAPIRFPKLRFVRYAQLFRFNHGARRLERFVRGACESPTSYETSSPQAFPFKGGSVSLTSNLTRSEYETRVRDTLAHIHAGDFYQANITRKFYGVLAETPGSLALFCRLAERSPAPYSAYIRHGEQAILSASPECFLTIGAEGTLTTRPIKGSARRGVTPEEDEILRTGLTSSEKNHAENLMIVDLMRNDLAQVSVPHSVKVTEQSALYSYATIHHLISTVTAQKRADVSRAEVLRALFPAGSMTGAPKIAAMRWCAAQEGVARGVYSGAIGWLGTGDTCDFSVVIRTLLLEGNHFEFQVGGGIVADSTPEDEWQETLTKARAIADVLGIGMDALETL